MNSCFAKLAISIPPTASRTAFTSLATYLSRFLGVVSAEKIKETSKMFRWFNCLAYSTLAALIARIVIFPSGSLSEIDYLIRFIVVILSVGVFY